MTARLGFKVEDASSSIDFNDVEKPLSSCYKAFLRTVGNFSDGWGNGTVGGSCDSFVVGILK